jgi:alginate O-acetyltransferase complex protein AlgI
MVFSSTLFLAWFLPLFLGLYTLADHRYKNLVILFGSVVFYAWGAPKFIFVVLLTTFLDFHLVKWMAEAGDERRRKRLLWASVGLNLGLLACFKYSNFFIDNFNGMLEALGMGTLGWTEIVLPLGLSFFIFESLTYVFDVYRKVHPPLRNFWDYQMYILFFPKLIAGPIVRFHEIAAQVRTRTHTPDHLLTGFYRFCLGLGKKVIIANAVGSTAQMYLGAEAADLSAGEAWLGMAAFYIQVYFDFSGYSDMALGLARMMGFDLPENFNSPYISRSIQEFWQRWHITLGSWMRQYLYIPLGGNHGSTALTYRNLALVFLASGLWHGASWNFVLWGMYHGTWLILERLFLLKMMARIPGLLRMAFTNAVVLVGCVLFSTHDFGQASAYFGAMFGGGPGTGLVPTMEFWLLAPVALAFAWMNALPFLRGIERRVFATTQTLPWHALLLPLSLGLFYLCLAIVSWSPYNPFIYFRF